MNIDNKKKNIEEELSYVFVEKYDFFKDIINKINNIFKKYDINYQYTYNNFCIEYINKCKEIIDNNPDIDLDNDNYFLIYGIISASMVYDKEKIYGKDNE